MAKPGNQSKMLQAALSWLELGAGLLPCQHKSKYLMRGYGQYQKVITEQSQACEWFAHGIYNLAVLTPPGLLALDFDDGGLYNRWLDALPVDLAMTYHEFSPRGFHVFYWCDAPALELVAGVEIKRVILVAPSELPGFRYSSTIPPYPILKVDDYTNILAGLSLLSSEKPAADVVPGLRAGPGGAVDVVSRIRAAYPIYKLASSHTKLKPSDTTGRWFIGQCVLPGNHKHDDKHPSFYVDTHRGMFGCRACGIRGDVINLYAVIFGVSLQEAIRALAREVLTSVPG